MNRSYRGPAISSALALLLSSGCGTGAPEPVQREQASASPDLSSSEAASAASLSPATVSSSRRSSLSSERAARFAQLERQLAPWLEPPASAWLAAHVPAPRAVESGAAPVPRRVRLPEQAREPVRLESSIAHAGIAVTLVGARPSAKQPLDALGVYPEALGPGTALLMLPREPSAGPAAPLLDNVGFEDHVAFTAPPREPQVEYRVELDAGIAGLRLVERTLELLDESGTPLWRVSPPVLVGADGAITNAELAVLDCAVDDSPAPPWGRAPRDPGARACSVRVSWDAAGVRYPALLDPAWTSAASMSEPRESFASMALAGGRILAAGGIAIDTGAPTASAELFDPASNTWSVSGSLATARSAFTLAARDLASGGAGVLAIGGDGGDGPLADTELYDPSAGTWAPGPALPVASSGHSSVVLHDGAILVAGGSAGTASSLLEAGAASWSPVGELFASEPGSTLTLLDDGGVLLVGPNAPGAQLYSPDEFQWLTTAEPAVARAGHTATLLADGRVLLVGGSGSQLVELYDRASQRFALTGGTSEAHIGHTATLLADGRVAIVGGAPQAAAGGTEIYDPTWGTWTPGPGTATARSSHRAELLGDSRVLAFGGDDAGVTLSSAELLDAARPATVISEYKLPARVDATVTASTFTELWAAVAR
ncbi:MAG TPA: hypothetical protein VMG12_42020, partial [Polyangiaceae bacterium]|nr:hypothetical protein [Polyangiaceae bacterium]